MTGSSGTLDPGRRGRPLPAAIVGRDPDPRVLLGAALAGAALAALVLGVEQGGPLARAITALLALDVGAGLIGNASRSTRSFWAGRSLAARRTFVVVHLSAHPAALALLVDSAWLRWLLVGALLVKTALFAAGTRQGTGSSGRAVVTPQVMEVHPR